MLDRIKHYAHQGNGADSTSTKVIGMDDFMILSVGRIRPALLYKPNRSVWDADHGHLVPVGRQLSLKRKVGLSETPFHRNNHAIIIAATKNDEG